MDLEPLLAAHGRVLTAAQLNAALSRRQRAAALRTGALVRLHNGIYACGPSADDAMVRWRAALACTAGRGALGYITGLAVYGVLPANVDDPVHVVTDRGIHLRGDARSVVHRRAHFVLTQADVVQRIGLATLSLERCLLDTWQLRLRDRRRAAFINAVRERRTSVERILAVTASVAIPDRAELMQLLDLIGAGCASELEIWGHLHVFTAPGMPPFTRQFRVQLGSAVRYLDLAHVPSKTAIELDGWEFHGNRVQRERDLHRDAQLAAAGWLTVRCTATRLYREPDVVRREVLAIIAARTAAALPTPA